MTNLKQTSFVVRRLLKNEPHAMNISLEKRLQMAICRWAKKRYYPIRNGRYFNPERKIVTLNHAFNTLQHFPPSNAK